MEHRYPKQAFSIVKHPNGIATIEPNDEDAETTTGFLGQALLFADQLLTLLEQDEVKGVLYYPLFPHPRMRFKQLFREEQRLPLYQQKLLSLLNKIDLLKKQPKPLIAYLNNPYAEGLDLSVSLWGHYTLTNTNIYVNFPESNYGLLPGFGAIAHTFERMSIADAYDFLTQGTNLNAKEGSLKGLFTKVLKEDENPIDVAQTLALNHVPFINGCRFSDKDLELLHSLTQNSSKKSRGLIPGLNALLKIIDSLTKPGQEPAIEIEAREYSSAIASKLTMAMVRTGYYLMTDVKRVGVYPFQLDNVGIIGAGMMGAGIAYEAAKAGAKVYLQDTTREIAEKGKNYSEKVCQKLIQQGKMNNPKMRHILDNIVPVTDLDQCPPLDLIVEAVFEDMTLKKEIITSYQDKLDQNGLFATNTTSLPITELAKSTYRPENFIGMHFFSPVDRMKLVEIIRGKQTSPEVVEHAITIAFKMGKTMIVVNDSPGFFTSRVFFDYLLEAVTMLLEGIPALTIESEARAAGFGASPLAVLDEISLPLMLHVYNQLPNLTNSQQRTYRYLESMVATGRTGRKSKQGFYDYTETTKEIWLDPTLPKGLQSTPAGEISKRLLHVMALDSYRCLAEGIIDDPSDGDIGSTLGIGFPQHTGGVFSHIDLVGLSQFINDCVSYSDKGEQWLVPDSLRKLAAKNYVFYKGMKSNWK